LNYLDKYSKEIIWNFLSEIPDPEIPVITIEELGVLRDVDVLPNKVIVTITPTYTGCPAMKVFNDDIIKVLHKNGIENAEIKITYSPAWTTDWITPRGRKALEDYGIV